MGINTAAGVSVAGGTVVAEAVDAAQNRGSASLGIILDQQAPVVQIASPADGNVSEVPRLPDHGEGVGGSALAGPLPPSP